MKKKQSPHPEASSLSSPTSNGLLDDCNIHAPTLQSAEQALESIRIYLEKVLEIKAQ